MGFTLFAAKMSSANCKSIAAQEHQASLIYVALWPHLGPQNTYLFLALQLVQRGKLDPVHHLTEPHTGLDGRIFSEGTLSAFGGFDYPHMVGTEFSIKLHLTYRPIILALNSALLGRSYLPCDDLAVICVVHMPQGRIGQLIREGEILRHLFSSHGISLPRKLKNLAHDATTAGRAMYHWRTAMAAA